MKRLAALAFAAAVATTTPALAAESGYKIPIGTPDVSGAFWLSPPVKGHYVCPMDPDVHADVPGTCPKCHMDLELAPTKVRLVLSAADGSLAGKSATLAVVGQPSFRHVVKFDVRGAAETNFALPPGTYTLSADLVTPGAHHRVHLTAPYKVR